MTRRFQIVAMSLALALELAGCAEHRVARDPLSAEEHLDLGVAYYRGGAPRPAAREFQQATALRPRWARAWVNLGDARLAAGEVALAIEAYERAVALDPGDPGAANNLAWALLQDARRWPQAESLARHALARDGGRRGYYLDTLGVVLLRKGDAEGALETFRAALADPGLGEAATRALVLEHMADAYAATGDPQAATRCRALAGEERRRDVGGSVGHPASVC